MTLFFITHEGEILRGCVCKLCLSQPKHGGTVASQQECFKKHRIKTPDLSLHSLEIRK